QLVDVLPAFRMAAAGHVRVRVFIDQQQVRSARERRIEVELLDHLVAIRQWLAGKDVETLDQLLGFASPVRLDQPGNHVAPGRPLRARSTEHRVGLADARCCAEKNLQMSPTLLLGLGKKGIGRTSLCFGGRHALSGPVSGPQLKYLVALPHKSFSGVIYGA